MLVRASAYGLILSVILFYVAQGSAMSETQDDRYIRPGAKVFIEEMDGFENYLTAAFHSKQVPVVIVGSKDEADFIFSGSARSNGKKQKATVKAVNKKGVVVYAFAFDDDYALHGQRSAAEACAKDLKKDMMNH